MLDNLLKGHRNQRKAVKLMIMFYYSEKIQIKISKGERVYRVESKRNQVRVSSYPLLMELHDSAPFLQLSCMTAWQSGANQGSLPESWCPEFFLGVSYIGMEVPT